MRVGSWLGEPTGCGKVLSHPKTFDTNGHSDLCDDEASNQYRPNRENEAKLSVVHCRDRKE